MNDINKLFYERNPRGYDFETLTNSSKLYSTYLKMKSDKLKFSFIQKAVEENEIESKYLRKSRIKTHFFIEVINFMDQFNLTSREFKKAYSEIIDYRLKNDFRYVH